MPERACNGWHDRYDNRRLISATFRPGGQGPIHQPENGNLAPVDPFRQDSGPKVLCTGFG